MRRTDSASQGAGQGSAGNHPELWVQLGEETRNAKRAILETVQELKHEMARLREENSRITME